MPKGETNADRLKFWKELFQDVTQSFPEMAPHMRILRGSSLERAADYFTSLRKTPRTGCFAIRRRGFPAKGRKSGIAVESASASVSGLRLANGELGGSRYFR